MTEKMIRMEAQYLAQCFFLHKKLFLIHVLVMSGQRAKNASRVIVNYFFEVVIFMIAFPSNLWQLRSWTIRRFEPVPATLPAFRVDAQPVWANPQSDSCIEQKDTLRFETLSQHQDGCPL